MEGKWRRDFDLVACPAPVAAVRADVDKLVQADKDFEFLMFPGDGHCIGESRYAARKRMDFFVRHLHGVEPRAK